MEIFGGQSSHYLYVLAGLSVILFAFLFFMAGQLLGWEAVRTTFVRSGVFWVCILIALLPLGIGVRYWALLREEELTITDDYLARHSHWGDERIEWPHVRTFVRQHILFRQSLLGRVAGISHLMTHRRLIVNLPPIRYELVAQGPDEAQPHVLRLDPGTIDDLDWLLQLITERVGPPEWV